MADSTRSKSHLDRLEEAIAKLTMNQLSLTATQNSMTLKIESNPPISNIINRSAMCSFSFAQPSSVEIRSSPF